MNPAPANGEESAPIKPLNIWRPSQFLEWVEPPGSHLLLPARLTKGELTTLIGQGGLGKTRLALWLAICQILGRLWCGLETGGDLVKWLFLGDENSIARLKEDLRRVFSTLTPKESARVDEFLRLPALVEMDDCDVWLGDPVTQARIAATLETEKPGAIVADPLANFAPGDISKPGKMKEAIRTLLGIIRPVTPKAAVMLLHHAWTGCQNITQGIGWDAANFASGGKALFAAARCQACFPACATPQPRHESSAKRCGPLSNRAVAGTRIHGHHANLPSCQSRTQRKGTGENRAVPSPSGSVSAQRPALGFSAEPLIRPGEKAKNGSDSF